MMAEQNSDIEKYIRFYSVSPAVRVKIWHCKTDNQEFCDKRDDFESMQKNSFNALSVLRKNYVANTMPSQLLQSSLNGKGLA